MKNFALGVLTTIAVAAVAAAAYFATTVDYQAVALLAINNAIGVLYGLEALLLAA